VYFYPLSAVLFSTPSLQQQQKEERGMNADVKRIPNARFVI
jgi:hypothetical protein